MALLVLGSIPAGSTPGDQSRAGRCRAGTLRSAARVSLLGRPRPGDVRTGANAVAGGPRRA